MFATIVILCVILAWIFLKSFANEFGTDTSNEFFSQHSSTKVKIERECLTETWRSTNPDGSSYEYTRETVKDTVHLPNENMVPYIVQDTSHKKLLLK